MREAKTMLIELWFSINNYNSIKKIKEISFLTYNKEQISLKMSNVKTRKFNNFVRVTIDTLIEGVSPTSLKELATLEATSEDVSFNIVKSVVYGDDQYGSPVANETDISHKLSNHEPKVRHLVVTGVHGNFKDAREALKRASKFKGSKVIKLRA